MRARRSLHEGNLSSNDYNEFHNIAVLLLSEVVNLNDVSSKPTKQQLQQQEVLNYQYQTPSFPHENDFGAFQNYKSNPNYYEPFVYPPSISDSQKLVNKSNSSITTTMSDVYTVPPEIYTSNPTFASIQQNNINFNDNNQRKNKLNSGPLNNNQNYPQIQVNFNFTKPLQLTENNIIDVNNQIDTFIPIPTNFMSSSNHSSPSLSINPNSLHINDVNNSYNSDSPSTTSPESPNDFNQSNSDNKRKRKAMSKNQNLSCFICHETVTPEWRKGPDGNHTLCNACGLNYAKKIKFERQNLERQGRRKQSIDIIINYKKFHFSKQIEEERAKKFEKKRSLSPLYQSNDISVSQFPQSNNSLNNSGNSFMLDNSLSSNLHNILNNSGFANNSLSEALNNILQSSNNNSTPTNNVHNNNNTSFNPNNNNNYQNMNVTNNYQNGWESNTLIFDNSTPYHYALKKENQNDYPKH